MLEFARDYLGDDRYDQLNRLYELMVDHNYGDVTDRLLMYRGQLDAVDSNTVSLDVRAVVHSSGMKLLADHGVTVRPEVSVDAVYHLLWFLLNFERTEDPYLIESIAMGASSTIDAFSSIACEYTPLDPDDLLYDILDVDVQLIAKMVELNKVDELDGEALPIYDDVPDETDVAIEQLLPAGIPLQTALLSLEDQMDINSPLYPVQIYDICLHSGLTLEEARVYVADTLVDLFDDPIELSNKTRILNTHHAKCVGLVNG